MIPNTYGVYEMVTINRNNSRLQVEVSAEQLAHIQALMSVCGFRTQKELINNAITMFEWAVEEVQRGNAVASFNKAGNTYEVLGMPALKAAARNGLERGHAGMQSAPTEARVAPNESAATAINGGMRPAHIA